MGSDRHVFRSLLCSSVAMDLALLVTWTFPSLLHGADCLR